MNMPKLIPLAIKTKGKGFFARIWLWRTSARKWELLEDWKFRLPDGLEIIIPKKFKLDGASIPHILWSILSPTGLLLIPAILHDFGYRFNYLWAVTEGDFIYKYGQNSGKKFWDVLFKKVAIEVNGTICIDFVAWLAIKLFGWMAWRANRRRNAEEIRPMRLEYSLNLEKKKEPEYVPMDFLAKEIDND